eukprot:5331963-Amphidinium_carterae.3
MSAIEFAAPSWKDQCYEDVTAFWAARCAADEDADAESAELCDPSHAFFGEIPDGEAWRPWRRNCVIMRTVTLGLSMCVKCVGEKEESDKFGCGGTHDAEGVEA